MMKEVSPKCTLRKHESIYAGKICDDVKKKSRKVVIKINSK